jgi:protein-S-isoprenylcysteine O-methyltransferase Ste14
MCVVMLQKLKYLLLELIIVYCGVLLHWIFPFFSLRFDGQSVFFIENKDFLLLNYLYFIYIPYAFFSHYTLTKIGKASRVERLLRAFQSKTFTSDFYLILRIFSVKLLYIPLMYLAAYHYGWGLYYMLCDFSWTTVHSLGVVELINQTIYPIGVWLAMWLALFVYLVGYVIESHRFKNTIQSVENTWFGWAITLICYVPFYPFLAYILPIGSQDFAYYKSAEITALVRILLLLILLLKTIAIFNLGLKSSNLTYRGLVTHGVYRYIRHPHYITKLMLWWIGLLPSAWHYPWLIGPMFFWTMVYYWRARTEEAHLLRCDPAYKTYMEKVKYRFIPGII